MPETQGAGGGKARREQERPSARVPPGLTFFFKKPKHPKHRHRERDAPKRRCGGTGLRQAHEDRRKRDAGGAEQQGNQRRTHVPLMSRMLEFLSWPHRAFPSTLLVSCI